MAQQKQRELDRPIKPKVYAVDPERQQPYEAGALLLTLVALELSR
jgi:hypothetical protein